MYCCRILCPTVSVTTLLPFTMFWFLLSLCVVSLKAQTPTTSPTTSPTLCVFKLGRNPNKRSHIFEDFLPKTTQNKLNLLTDITDYCSEGNFNIWSGGVNNGYLATAVNTDDEIDYDLIYCQEGFYTSGYVPIESSTGAPLCPGGVRIGAGVDLGLLSRDDLLSVHRSILDKLDIYFGITGETAAKQLCLNGPLELTQSEAEEVSDVAIGSALNRVTEKYNSDKPVTSKTWAELTKGVRTVLVSMYYIRGEELFSLNFWEFMIDNDFHNGIIDLALLSAVDSSGTHLGCISQQRYAELANVLRLSCPCTSQIDVVFLVDESGSVGPTHFETSKNFMINFVNNFESAGDQFRFAVSKFNNFYTPIFNLNTYNTIEDIITAISGISYNDGGTSLRFAMNEIASDQFVESKGMRPDNELVPRIAIILTDGQSTDGTPDSTLLLAKDVTVLAIGVAGFSIDQLRAFALEENIFTTNDFDGLVNLITDITTASCNAAAPIDIPDGPSSDIEIGDLSIKVVSTNINVPSDNSDGVTLIVEIEQKTGCVYVYASFCTEFPNLYNHQYSVENCGNENKQLEVNTLDSQNCPNSNRRRLQDETVTLFMGVEGITPSNTFTIDINECNGDCGITTTTTTTTIAPGGRTTEAVCVAIDSNIPSALQCVDISDERTCVGFLGLCKWIKGPSCCIGKTDDWNDKCLAKSLNSCLSYKKCLWCDPNSGCNSYYLCKQDDSHTNHPSMTPTNRPTPVGWIDSRACCLGRNPIKDSVCINKTRTRCDSYRRTCKWCNANNGCSDYLRCNP